MPQFRSEGSVHSNSTIGVRHIHFLYACERTKRKKEKERKKRKERRRERKKEKGMMKKNCHELNNNINGYLLFFSVGKKTERKKERKRKKEKERKRKKERKKTERQ